MKVLVLGFSILLIFTGCSGIRTAWSGIAYDKSAGLASLSNTTRNFIVDYGNGKTSRLQRCLESPGPAVLLSNSGVRAKVDSVGNVAGAGIDLNNTEALAKLYEVSSIIQFSHVMSYRLCEAYINEAIKQEDYKGLFEKIITSTGDLLKYQADRAEAEAKKAEAKAIIVKAVKSSS